MKTKRGEQAENALWYAKSGLGEMLSLGQRCTRKTVEPSADALEDTPLDQPSQLNTRGSQFFEVTTSRDTCFFQSVSNMVAQRV
jgi:hypothetical protein